VTRTAYGWRLNLLRPKCRSMALGHARTASAIRHASVRKGTPLSEKISRRTLTGCKWKGLLELIEQVRARTWDTASRGSWSVCAGAGIEGQLGRVHRRVGADDASVAPKSNW
jgi:hypothetical protein